MFIMWIVFVVWVALCIKSYSIGCAPPSIASLMYSLQAKRTMTVSDLSPTHRR